MEYEELVKNLNHVRAVSFEKEEKPREGYVEEYVDKKSGLSICFTRHFPLNIPDFFVKPAVQPRPHVESNGKICLFDSSSILLNDQRLNELIVECYDQAIGVLEIEEGSAAFDTEILREADAYWLQKATKFIVSTVDLTKVSYANYEMLSYSDSGVITFYVSDNVEKTRALGDRLSNYTKNKKYFNACTVIRLKKGSPIIPIKKRYGWNELRQYIRKNTDNGVKRRFQQHTDEEKKIVIESIILVLPTTFGEVAFGFLIMGRSNRWVAMSHMLGLECTPLYVRRMDYGYLTNRAGAMSELCDKQVLLLGCGSVGGYIAENLCKMGIRTLDILDKDSFSEENLFRHYLGMSALTSREHNKAALMKQQLESEFLDIDVDSLDYRGRTVEAYLENDDRLKNYDLIISALGEPTLNLRINKIIHDKKIKVPFICAYNEPYGLGGHSILVNHSEEGCLECLYTEIDSTNLRENRVSLVQPGQQFKKNISGCGSAFVPYSALDSQQTAINTVRLAVSVLRGDEKENCIVTWFGDDKHFLSQGFITSDFYRINKNKVQVRLPIKRNCHCRVCKEG